MYQHRAWRWGGGDQIPFSGFMNIKYCVSVRPLYPLPMSFYWLRELHPPALFPLRKRAFTFPGLTALILYIQIICDIPYFQHCVHYHLTKYYIKSIFTSIAIQYISKFYVGVFREPQQIFVY